MANLPIKDKPQFSQTMEETTKESIASPETFNPRYQVLLDNDNYLKKAAERQKLNVHISIPASVWSATEPYTQSISISGITEEDSPIVGLSIAEGTAAAVVKNQNKAWGCVDRAVTGNGTITFYCYNKKPAVDFSVNVKGV